MGIFSGLFGETVEKRLSRWRSELLEALPDLLPEGDAFWPNIDSEEVIIQHGSVHVVVGFAVDEEEGEGYVIIESPLVFLPKDNLLPFYRRLLDLNKAPLLLGSLSTEDNVVVLRRTVPIRGLDEEGFGLNVFNLCAEADDLDDLLIEEFGTRRFEVTK